MMMKAEPLGVSVIVLSTASCVTLDMSAMSLQDEDSADGSICVKTKTLLLMSFLHWCHSLIFPFHPTRRLH